VVQVRSVTFRTELIRAHKGQFYSAEKYTAVRIIQGSAHKTLLIQTSTETNQFFGQISRDVPHLDVQLVEYWQKSAVISPSSLAIPLETRNWDSEVLYC